MITKFRISNFKRLEGAELNLTVKRSYHHPIPKERKAETMSIGTPKVHTARGRVSLIASARNIQHCRFSLNFV